MAQEFRLPRHPSNERVNAILETSEQLIRRIHAGQADPDLKPPASRGNIRSRRHIIGLGEQVFAISPVDMGATQVVGFDYDYTLIMYKPAVLYLIYELAKQRLVEKMGYPKLLTDGLPGFDPTFAIRGLAVDIETAWICKCNFRYKVAVAFRGRTRVSRREVQRAFSKNGGILGVDERKKRLRPLNDLFSTVEACFLADVVQWFQEEGVPFEPRSVVNDVLEAVAWAHTSGKMHRTVAEDLDKYADFSNSQHVRELLRKLRSAGKEVMLVSNSAFWYVDAGMKRLVGDEWRDLFDTVIVQAGKPAFYTGDRPFREVSKRTGRVKFKPINEIEKDEVYCQGSIGELMRLKGWEISSEDGHQKGSQVLYLGDSIFADLVYARRMYGWSTGAIIPEVRDELDVHSGTEWRRAKHTVHVLFHCMQICQENMFAQDGDDHVKVAHSGHDKGILDSLEVLAAKWYEKQEALLNKNFGSAFRSPKRFSSVPSRFARSLEDHADLYMSGVENLRLYSTDHRFYPSDGDMRSATLHEATHMTDSIFGLFTPEMCSAGFDEECKNEVEKYLSQSDISDVES
eukprot:TRINITY_DN27609_c0_g1_i2.p1 TRINITY_DN27609_c0_g1~~TRINITY_DN27609_c0_g1_i2.p1  ORF type:complete len:571 (+),score=139.26 TRINITY_DN27609_c0_g1_i2:119-1831(+)